MSAATLPIVARNLEFARGDAPILRGVDLETPEDPSVLAILGPNGAGKSVLLQILHGLIAPDRGSVLWAGSPPDDARRRRQAYLRQTPILLDRTLAGNLDYVLGLRGFDRAERLCARAAILRRAGLEALAERPARALSGGEAQRLAIARAIALDAEIWLLDEPCASLDPRSAREIETLIADAGVAALLVTHDVAQAKRLAREVAFMHHGRIVERAPAARFFERPASAAARAYLEGRLID